MFTRFFKKTFNKIIYQNYFQFSKNSNPEPKCKLRRNMYTFFRDSFNKNIDQMSFQLQHSPLNLACQILENMKSYSIRNENLYQMVKGNIRRNIHQLDPEMCMRILFSLDFWIQGDEVDILKSLYTYVKQLFYLFSYSDLEMMEKSYFYLSSYINLEFSPFFASFIAYQKAKSKKDSFSQSKDILHNQNIVVPPFLDVLVQCYDARINIRFKDSDQTLKIYGSNYNNLNSLLKLKEILLIQRKSRSIILQMPPLTSTNLIEKTAYTQKQEKVNKFINQALQQANIQINDDDPKTLINKFGSMPFLPNNTFIDFYIENYLTQNKADYCISEAERVVYFEEYYLAKVDIYNSILFSIYKIERKKNYNFFLCDLPFIEQMMLLAQEYTTEQLNSIFSNMRYSWFNALASWSLSVFKQGCPSCENLNDEGPRKVKDQSNYGDIYQKIRLNHQITKILKYLAINKEQREFLVFVNEKHLFSILRMLISHLQNEENRVSFINQLKQAKNISEQYQELSQKPKLIDFDRMKNEEKEEFINKLALITAIFQEDIKTLPSQMVSHQDLYLTLLNEYNQLLNPSSFNTAPWKSGKDGMTCFAYKILFKSEKSKQK